jgi:hypothetical protein
MSSVLWHYRIVRIKAKLPTDIRINKFEELSDRNTHARAYIYISLLLELKTDGK